MDIIGYAILISLLPSMGTFLPPHVLSLCDQMWIIKIKTSLAGYIYGDISVFRSTNDILLLLYRNIISEKKNELF